MKRRLCVLALFLLGCAPDSLPELPQAISNNAVAYHQPTHSVYSFAGLETDKTFKDVSAKAFVCHLDASSCQTLPPIPDGVGRLAATAQTIGDNIYIFGGYSVASDGSEISTPDVFAFDVNTREYIRKPDMPVPVDDSVSVVYKDRYIYLVSGWHKDDNVVNVQMFDAQTDTWSPASDWPGAPVFGHAGAIVDGVIVVCDGVHIVPPKSPATKRTFETLSACWRGDIDPKTPTKITWRKLPPLPGKGKYRMAAAAWPHKHMVVFAGGTDNAYNYNGIGYNKIPSQPSAHVWGYDVRADQYVQFRDKPEASMDHRALVHLGADRFLIVGGMGTDQQVRKRLEGFKVHK